MKTSSRTLALILLSLAVAVTNSHAAPLRGVGAQYMEPMYQLLSRNYGAYDKSFAIDYRNTGFDDAVKLISRNEADFAVIDIPMARRDLDQAKLLKFPTLITAIVPVVNIPGVKSDQLILSGPLLADIMAGTIANWNAPEIAALNPGLVLPNLPIKRVVRQKASGATLAFTSYLARSSGDFAKSIGSAPVVKWPGNYLAVDDGDAAANMTTATEGAISYVEMDVAIIRFLTFASLKHKGGQIRQARLGFLRTGVVSAKVTSADDPELTVIDDGQNWPILLPVYIVIPQVAGDGEQAKKLLKFFYWNFHNGDRAVEYWGSVPLPTSVQSKAIRIFRKVRTASGAAVVPDFDYELAH